MPDNQIKIQGNGNITLQDVNGQNVTINVNDVAEFKQLIERLPNEIILQLREQLKLQSNNSFTNAKNIVTGNIKARNIHIGDIYNIKSPDFPRQLTAQFPTTDPDQIVGRKNDLDKVRQQLSANQQVVLVNGIGGVGKTTLAQAYAYAYGGEYVHVAWINCLSQDFAADVIQTANLLQNLRINASGKDPQTLCMEVLNGISNLEQTPGLLIIDNAETDLTHYINALPKAPGWHTLITSRQRLGNEHFTEIPLDFLAAEDAELLFQKHYTRSDLTPDNIKELVKGIDYHTLTIEILAKTAQKQRSTMPQLREALRTDLKANIPISHNDHQKIERITSYLVSIFNLSQLTPDELWLMQQFTCLPPDFHDYDTLLELIQPEATKRSDIFSETLEDLVDKGWLLSKGEQYKMHRIIGEVTIRKKSPSVEEVLPLIENVIDKLYKDDAKDNPVDKFPWINFGEAALHQFEENNTLRITVLQNNLAIILKDLGDYDRAKTLLEKAMRSDEQNFGEHHPKTALRYSNLALVLQHLGHYERAKELLYKAIYSNEQNFGEYHPDTAICYSNLAAILQILGDYKQAKKLLEKAIRSDEQNFGEHHPNTAVRYSNLALVLKDFGDYEGAKKLFEKTVRSAEKHLGEHHPTTAIRYSNLALMLQILGDYEGAKTLLEKAVRSTEQNFGEHHPATAINYSNLALVLQDLDDYEGAKILLEKTIYSAKQNFGEHHPTTANRYSNLALVLKALGDYKGAKELLEKTIRFGEQHFGEHHPTTGIRYSNLALILQILGDYNRAKALLEKATHSSEQNFGEKHPNTANRYTNLASVYINLNETKKAIDLWEKAYVIFYNTFGGEHPNTKTVQEWLDVYKPKP